MKPSRAIVAFVALVGLAISVLAVPYDISEWPASGKRKSQSITTNDVVVIKTPSGTVTVFQFTSFDAHTADYRWRYRASPSKPVSSGQGQVRESYDSKPNDDGSYRVTPKADHDTTVRAGNITLEWSYGSTTNGWFYYNPDRATIQILKASAFDQDL